VEANVKIPYTPLPKQQEFHQSLARYRAYFGGFGSGKTKSGSAEAIHQSLWYPKNLGLVGRMTYPELRDTTRKEILEFPIICDGKEVELVSSPLVKKFNRSENVLTFFNGSQIIFRALEDAFHKIKSLNLGWFYIDELTEANDEIWLGLCGRLRRVGFPHTGFGTSNPEGRDWAWKRFVADKSKDYFYVHAPSTENSYLPPGYVQSLIDQYPSEWVKRYVYGSFDTFEGLVYKEFTERSHVIPSYDPDDHHYRFIGVDHGFRNPTAVLWGSVAPDGVVTIYDEYYQNGMLVSEIAEIVKTKSKKDLIRRYLIDPSCKNRNGKDGRSIIDEFEENGIYFDPANNDVRAGINRVQEYLKVNNGRAKLRITSNCTNLIREMMTYKWKDIKIGEMKDQPEKPLKKDDHAVDALRYMINFLYDTPPLKKKDRDYNYKKWLKPVSDWMAA